MWKNKIILIITRLILNYYMHLNIVYCRTLLLLFNINVVVDDFFDITDRHCHGEKKNCCW